eukprot:162388_1
MIKNHQKCIITNPKYGPTSTSTTCIMNGSFQRMKTFMIIFCMISIVAKIIIISYLAVLYPIKMTTISTDVKYELNKPMYESQEFILLNVNIDGSTKVFIQWMLMMLKFLTYNLKRVFDYMKNQI